MLKINSDTIGIKIIGLLSSIACAISIRVCCCSALMLRWIFLTVPHHFYMLVVRCKDFFTLVTSFRVAIHYLNEVDNATTPAVTVFSHCLQFFPERRHACDSVRILDSAIIFLEIHGIIQLYRRAACGAVLHSRAGLHWQFQGLLRLRQEKYRFDGTLLKAVHGIDVDPVLWPF